jgi:hypothetical protein
MGKTDGLVKGIPYLEPGAYADGSPLDDLHYLECKLILKPDRFTCVPSFHDFGKLVQRAADDVGVIYSAAGTKHLKPHIREVVFLDTRNFALYNHAFILRRRIAYEDGFPVGDPEIVFKFRHPDLQTAAKMDVRPRIHGAYRVKFKAETLPLREKTGGYRMLFSHNVEFGLSEARGVDSSSIATLVGMLPALAGLGKSGKKIELVNHTIVEEVLLDLGDLDFGKGVTAKSNAALWRQRGDHQLLVGEFSFECKFKRRRDAHEKAINRVRRFFITLQQVARGWVSLGTTKTGIVYRLRGNPPRAHE